MDDNRKLYKDFYNKEYRLKNSIPSYIDALSNPNMLTIENIYQKRCIAWLEKNYKNRILKKAFHRFSDSPIYEEMSYLLKGNILIHIHSDIFIDILFFDVQQERIAQDIADQLEKFK